MAAGLGKPAVPNTSEPPGWPHQDAARVAAGYAHSASHMLASVAELCPLALEQLLL